MENFSEQKKALRLFGLKVTSARLKVLDILSRSTVALSHADITNMLSEEDNIDKVTLYRTLNIFTESGLAHKVASEDRSWLYALHLHPVTPAEPDEHVHFVCDRCEKIYCLPIYKDAVIPRISSPKGFVITSQEYRLHGTCPTCN